MSVAIKDEISRLQSLLSNEKENSPEYFRLKEEISRWEKELKGHKTATVIGSTCVSCEG